MHLALLLLILTFRLITDCPAWPDNLPATLQNVHTWERRIHELKKAMKADAESWEYWFSPDYDLIPQWD